MLSLKAPGALFLALLIPLLIYLVHFRKKRGGKLEVNFSIWREEEFVQGVNPARIFSVILWIFFWLGMTSFIFALAGPVIIQKEKIFLTRGMDMIIVLDESPSMSATDFKPVNRFVSAKKVIQNFTEVRENDQIGLVTFSSEAVLRVPLTLDYKVLLEVMESLQIMELGPDTSIGKGIAVAALHLKSSIAKEKVIILITDGVNNTMDIMPEDAARVALELGIKIYTIGIGKESDKSWTFRDPKTGKEYLAKSGEFDEKLLTQIAALSGGKYFYAGLPRALSHVFDEIDSREMTEKRIKISIRETPMHKIFILTGLVLILISFFIRKWWLKEIL